MLYFINYDGISGLFNKRSRIRHRSRTCCYILKIYIFEISKKMAAQTRFS